MTKISSLTALTGAGVDDAADLLPIVDMSEAGSARNKKITIDETRIALGVSSADSPQFTAINLGHASDTTISRVSAGVVAIEGVNIVTTAGGVTFAADIVVPDEVYDATNWDGSLEVPTKNAVRDKIESISAGSGIAVEDEGVSEGTGITTLNFTGAGCSVTVVGAEAEVIVPGGGASALNDLSDVDTTGQTTDDVLTYDGANWVPQAPSGDLGALHLQDQRASGTASGNITSGAWRARALTDVVLNTIAGASHVASTVTISNASPGVISWTAHGLPAGSTVVFTTTGGLPTGLTVETVYYVLAPNTDDFTVSATPGGAAINTSSAGSGVHTANSSLFILPAGTYDFKSPVMGHQVDQHQGRLQNLTDASTTLLGMTARSRSTSSTDGTSIAQLNGRFVIAGAKTFELQHRVATTAAAGSPSSWGTEIYADVFIRKVA